MKFEDLLIPSAIANELRLIRLFVDDNLQFHKDSHNFSELIEELEAAITKQKENSGKNIKDCYIVSPCLIDPSAKILAGTTIIGPCIIGPNCKVGPNAYIRQGTILGQGVHVGFGAEIKESIIGSNTIVAHYSYIGNSLIGNNCEVSACMVFSAKRLDLSEVRLWTGENQFINTNCKKLGAVVGDNVKIGSGAIIMPGAYLSSNSIIWPNITVAKFVSKNSVIKTGQGLDIKQNDLESKYLQLMVLNLALLGHFYYHYLV